MQNGVIKLDPVQQKCVEDCCEWYLRATYGGGKPVFVIEGYAGCGKSSVVSFIMAKLNIPKHNVAYCCYTGKAANVLRSKGHQAFTIHHLIYNTRRIKDTDKFTYSLKKIIGENVALLCVDEIGMVPEEMACDLEKFQIPIIALGDPGQLPPVKALPNHWLANPDVVFEKVYRQSEDSSILEIATDVRNGISPYLNAYKDDVKVVRSFNAFDINEMMMYDQILCYKNRTRRMLNRIFRERILGIKDHMPQNGDKLICTINNFRDNFMDKNCGAYNLVNGTTLVSESELIGVAENNVGQLWCRADGTSKAIRIPVFLNDFENNYLPEEEQIPSGDPFGTPKVQVNGLSLTVNGMDYGYAISGHKSQGSQWKRVLVIDDYTSTGGKPYCQWMYTCLTRAEKYLCVVSARDISKELFI